MWTINPTLCYCINIAPLSYLESTRCALVDVISMAPAFTWMLDFSFQVCPLLTIRAHTVEMNLKQITKWRGVEGAQDVLNRPLFQALQSSCWNVLQWNALGSSVMDSTMYFRLSLTARAGLLYNFLILSYLQTHNEPTPSSSQASHHFTTLLYPPVA
jgi:hypothetical protein